MAKGKSEATFENDLETLESIVAALEEGGLSLDDALKQFESGITLARRCEKALGDAEKKIEILMKNAEGELEAQPFDESAPPEAPKAESAKAAPERVAPPVRAAAAPTARTHDDEPEPVPEPDDEDLLF